MRAMFRRRHRHPPIVASVHADNVAIETVGPDGRVARVGWGELDEVQVRTTSRGPVEEDVFLVFRSKDGSEFSIPQSLAPSSLVEQMQRLDGFDNEQLIAAMCSVTDATFVCWRSR